MTAETTTGDGVLLTETAASKVKILLESERAAKISPCALLCSRVVAPVCAISCSLMIARSMVMSSRTSVVWAW